MRTITAAQLVKLSACHVQVALFRKLFPSGKARVTEALCLAHAQYFDWGWASRNILTDKQRKAYYEATAPALKAYDEATAPALKAYYEALASAFCRAFNS